MNIIGRTNKRTEYASLAKGKDNSLYIYTGSSFTFEASTVEFEYAPVFQVALMPDGFIRGRSSVIQQFKDEYGNEYKMAADATSKFIEALASGDILVRNGLFYGQWTISKQGTMISLMPYYDEYIPEVPND